MRRTVMYLADLANVWTDVHPAEELVGTDLSLRLLAKTQELLEGGEHWRANALAYTYDGAKCDPLSPRAFYFSLTGAAARARWEMREELAAAGVNPAQFSQVMAALSEVGKDQRSEGGWQFASAVLCGMQCVLEEYRDRLIAESEERPQEEAA